MDFLNYIYNKYPIRRTEQQKEEFREYIIETAKRLKYPVIVEKLKDKHNNIIIGDIDNAKIIFTAHYDTPAASIFPNIMLPRRPGLSFLYNLTMNNHIKRRKYYIKSKNAQRGTLLGSYFNSNAHSLHYPYHFHASYGKTANRSA